MLTVALWPACPQQVNNSRGENFSAGFNAGLLSEAAMPTLTYMCRKN